MYTCFQSEGIVPFYKVCWNKWVNMGAGSSDADLRTFAGILSGPGALFWLISDNSLWIHQE